MAQYSARASAKVAKAMHERHEGTLRSGGSDKKVTSRKQAVAIGLSEAQAEGAKVPKKKPANAIAHKTPAKKVVAKKADPKKAAAKSRPAKKSATKSVRKKASR